MVNKTEVVDTILKHLNGELSEAQLVDWAEAAFVELTEGDTDHPDEDVMLDVLGAIGAGDSPGFSLTWAALRQHLQRLGVEVHVSTEGAA